MDRDEVVKAQTGQVLRFLASEGRPSATPSVGVKDQGGTVISAAAATNVTLDPVTTTTSGAAAAGARTITLTAVTSIRMGAVYRLTNAFSQLEDVRVRGIDTSGKIVHLDEPLQNAHASGATFASCEFTYALQTADVATLGALFIATATYAVTGAQTAPLVRPFDVVLHPLHGRNPLTVALLKEVWPDLSGQEWDETRGEDYALQRKRAWQQVCDALWAAGRRPAMVVSAEGFTRWALAEFALILQEGGVSVIRNVDPQVALERLDRKLTEAKQAALSGISWYEGETEDEAFNEETEARPLPTHLVA